MMTLKWDAMWVVGCGGGGWCREANGCQCECRSATGCSVYAREQVIDARRGQMCNDEAIQK